MRQYITILLCVLFIGLFLFYNKNTQPVENQPIVIEEVEYYPTPSPTNNERVFSEHEMAELECLAKNIYYESGAEGMIGWIAVGKVTMNRVKSKLYPNTICEVVYQNNGKVWQFSWTNPKKKLTKPNESLYNRIYEISLLIFLHNEYLYDVTHGALNFHASYIHTNWGTRLHKTVKIGNHIFYRN